MMAWAMRHDVVEAGLNSRILAVCRRTGVCAPTYMVLVGVLASVEFSVGVALLEACELGFCFP